MIYSWRNKKRGSGCKSWRERRKRGDMERQPHAGRRTRARVEEGVGTEG